MTSISVSNINMANFSTSPHSKSETVIKFKRPKYEHNILLFIPNILQFADLQLMLITWVIYVQMSQQQFLNKPVHVIINIIYKYKWTNLLFFTIITFIQFILEMLYLKKKLLV